jgi:hypothetical protein
MWHDLETFISEPCCGFTISSIEVPSICAMYIRVLVGRISEKFAIFSAVRGITSSEKFCSKPLKSLEDFGLFAVFLNFKSAI